MFFLNNTLIKKPPEKTKVQGGLGIVSYGTDAQTRLHHSTVFRAAIK